MMWYCACNCVLSLSRKWFVQVNVSVFITILFGKMLFTLSAFILNGDKQFDIAFWISIQNPFFFSFFYSMQNFASIWFKLDKNSKMFTVSTSIHLIPLYLVVQFMKNIFIRFSCMQNAPFLLKLNYDRKLL